MWYVYYKNKKLEAQFDGFKTEQEAREFAQNNEFNMRNMHICTNGTNASQINTYNLVDYSFNKE
jgi:hypothetical protein